MFRDAMIHVPWTSLVLAGELMFFTIFTASLFWIFREGSKDYYDRIARMPYEGGSHE